MHNKDSLSNTVIVAVTLCVVCSSLVSAAAVLLKPLQDANKELDKQRNIIAAAKLFEGKPSADEVKKIFERIEKKVVDLQTGKIVPDGEIPEKFDPRKMAKDPETAIDVGTPKYSIGSRRREPMTYVYFVKNESDPNQIDQYVFPVYGRGLWSTLYGYIAVQNDFNTINGLTFYEHAETPGLGGEVDAGWWKEQWPGKKIYADAAIANDDKIRIGIAKGSPQGDAANYEVDGLSGATITSKGVSDGLKYWFSQDGYGKFIQNQLAAKGE